MWCLVCEILVCAIYHKLFNILRTNQNLVNPHLIRVSRGVDASRAARIRRL